MMDEAPIMFGISVDALTLMNSVSEWGMRQTPANAAGNTSNTCLSQEKDMAELQKLGGVEGVAKLLICDPAVGIDPSDCSLEPRKSQYGVNKLPETPPASFWALLVCLLASQAQLLSLLMISFMPCSLAI